MTKDIELKHCQNCQKIRQCGLITKETQDNRYQDRYLNQLPHLVPILSRQLLENSEGAVLIYELKVILSILDQLTHIPQQFMYDL